MIKKTGEKPNLFRRNIVKKTDNLFESTVIYLSILSILGLKLTKVQIMILAALIVFCKDKPISSAEKKEVLKLVSTTPQVIENTLTVLRKKGLITNENTLSDMFAKSITDNSILTINLIKDASRT